MKNKIRLLGLLLFALPNFLFSQVLETEESKPLQQGQFEIGAGLELQTSSEGKEYALPLSIEYGISKRLTLLVEPVLFTSIRPKNGSNSTGLGDLEVTLFYQVMREKQVMPSLSISGEVKLPTAKNKLIGTGKTDFTPYIILSKTTGNFFSSLNLSYTFVGKPDSATANNLFNYAIGTIFKPVKNFIVFAEVYGNTTALSEGDGAENIVNPNINTTELSGGETVFAGGVGFYPKENILLSLGVSYDNNRAVLIRPGVVFVFGGKKTSGKK